MLLFTTVLYSCEKGNDADNGGGGNPLPVIKPDTLTAGWAKLNIDTTESFNDVFFIDNNNGYITGKNTYQTTNGGLNWIKKSTRGFTNIFITPNNSVFFTGSQNLLQDSVHKSVDGAVTLSSSRLDSKLTDVFFTDNNNGFCFTLNSVWYTSNGGASWINTYPSTPAASHNIGYCTLFFRSATKGWLIDGSRVFRTNGSINSWQYSFAGVDAPGTALSSIYATSDNVVYVMNNYGEFYKSTDGGVIFNLIKNFGCCGFGDIHFLNDNLGFVSYGKRIYKTTDGGNNWTVEIALGEASINEIHFTDATHGWACGTNGVLLKLN